VIEQKPEACVWVITGKTAPRAGSLKLRRRPSHGRQPKFGEGDGDGGRETGHRGRTRPHCGAANR
jgi:hypothetical protein